MIQSVIQYEVFYTRKIYIEELLSIACKNSIDEELSTRYECNIQP